MKKFIMLTMSFILLFIMTSCNVTEDYYPEFESGYYRYAVKTEKDGAKKAYLLELTDLGKEQTILIYPDEIDGIPVYGIGYGRQLIFGQEVIGNFESENSLKIILIF